MTKGQKIYSNNIRPCDIFGTIGQFCQISQKTTFYENNISAKNSWNS